MTKAQREALIYMQRRGDVLHSPRSLRVKRATLQSLEHFGMVKLYDEIDIGEDELMPYYMMTEAGKKWKPEEATTE